MKIAFDEAAGTIALADVGPYYNTLTGATNLRWVKQRKTLEGPADLETLNRLAQIIRLPEHVEKHRRMLQRIRDTVEAVRDDPQPVAVIPPPVNATLYAHQVRAYDMALLTFGAVTPEQVEEAKRHGQT